MKSKWIKSALVILLALCLAALCACGNPDADVDAAPDPEQNGATQTLKVGMAGLDIKTACIIIAKQLGYFEEEGVDVQFETISNLADGLTAVDQGKLDILPFGVIPTCTFVAQGSDVVVFGGTISEGSEIIVTADKAGSINSAADFRGQRIGCYRMETGHMVIKGFLREAGIDTNADTQFIYLDSQASIVEAVKKGEVDMGFVNSGYGYIAQQSGLVVVARAGDFVADFPCCRQTTSRAALTAKRQALVKFEIAALRGYMTYLTDHQTAIDALVDYCGQDAKYVEAVMYGLAGEYDHAMIISLDPNKNKVVEFYEIMQANGDIAADTAFKMADHVDVTIYEDALNEMISREPDNAIFSQLRDEFAVNNF
ncbi:MAG: ABC transporter substrate-binding protein [Clostridia bacterium]|nr:ABC transporter substrate-binding protein [Clostridia bacterium]